MLQNQAEFGVDVTIISDKFDQLMNFTVAQFGDLKRAEAEHALELASKAQRGYDFTFYPGRFPLDTDRYKLPNRGIDLEAAARPLVKKLKGSRPLILLTSAPFTDQDHGRIPKYFFYSGGVDDEEEVSILSTYAWEHLPGKRQLEPFILYQLALFILERCADLSYHSETRGCLFDYCDDPKDIDLGFEFGPLCNSCEHQLGNQLRSGGLNPEDFASAKKLFNIATGKKVCFVVMPFKRELKPVYDAIGKALQKDHWTVQRADEIGRPRRITDVIMQAILTSDLVVADLTGNNPNVFYEVGVAHAIGCDVILLTQERAIPFDIITERTIFYKNSPRGIQELASNLQWLASGKKT